MNNNTQQNALPNFNSDKFQFDICVRNTFLSQESQQKNDCDLCKGGLSCMKCAFKEAKDICELAHPTNLEAREECQDEYQNSCYQRNGCNKCQKCVKKVGDFCRNQESNFKKLEEGFEDFNANPMILPASCQDKYNVPYGNDPFDKHYMYPFESQVAYQPK